MLAPLMTSLVVGPCLTPNLSVNQVIAAAMAPSWWATGPHHETTNFEGNKMGSIRIGFIGKRNFACINGALWLSYLRSRDSSKGPSGSSSEPQVASLGSLSARITYQDAKMRFRNLTEVTQCTFT